MGAVTALRYSALETDFVDEVLALAAGRQENRIYASIDVLTQLAASEPSVYTGEVGFYVTDPKTLDEIVSKVQQIEEIDWKTHFIRTNDFQYSKISDSLTSLGDLIKILLACVSIVSAAILTLILTLRIRGRIPEAGILLGAGIPKGEIIKQFLLEVLSVAATAFLFSYAASFGISHNLGNHLLADFQPNLINAAALQNGISDAVSIDSYLTLGIEKTLLIYGCQLIVVVLSVLLSSASILKLKPREILTKMS